MTEQTTPQPDKRAEALEHKEWREKRNKALRELDVTAVPLKNPEVSLIALHKARYDCTDIEDDLRHESRMWLQERGYKRLYGDDFLPEGQLPE